MLNVTRENIPNKISILRGGCFHKSFLTFLSFAFFYYTRSIYSYISRTSQFAIAVSRVHFDRKNQLFTGNGVYDGTRPYFLSWRWREEKNWGKYSYRLELKTWQNIFAGKNMILHNISETCTWERRVWGWGAHYWIRFRLFSSLLHSSLETCI